MINRRTMLQVTGGMALAASLPEVTKATETRKPIAYIVVGDSWQPFIISGRRVINRAWHVYWSWNPELARRLSYERHKWERNVKTTPYYNIKDFPPPALKPLELKCPSCKSILEYPEYHCFRTYDIDCSGKVKIIYDEDGKVW